MSRFIGKLISFTLGIAVFLAICVYEVYDNLREWWRIC